MEAQRKWYVYLLAILIVHLALIITIRTVFAQVYKIPAASMRPTLEIGDHILVNQSAYGIRHPLTGSCFASCKTPNRGDVIVFIFPEDRSKDFIKRVIGIAGDLVEIRNKKVFIGGQPLEEPYTLVEEAESNAKTVPKMDNSEPVRVPNNKLFVLGDNRDKSYDSRFWGFVDIEDVKGRASIIYWSWDGNERWVRWERIGKRIY